MYEGLYSFDLLNRFSGHTFVETTIGNTVLVEFKNGSNVVVASAQRIAAEDAYRRISLNILNGKRPAFVVTITQRDALTDINLATRIWVIDAIPTPIREIWDGAKWVSSGGEVGGLVHLPAATVTTTDNTQTELSTIVLDENTAYLLTAEVIGETLDHGTVLGEIIECTAKRQASGSAVIVGNVSVTHSGKDSGASSWGATFTVSGNNLILSVTGANAATVKWESDLNYLKF